MIQTPGEYLHRQYLLELLRSCEKLKHFFAYWSCLSGKDDSLGLLLVILPPWKRTLLWIKPMLKKAEEKLRKTQIVHTLSKHQDPRLFNYFTNKCPFFKPVWGAFYCYLQPNHPDKPAYNFSAYLWVSHFLLCIPSLIIQHQIPDTVSETQQMLKKISAGTEWRRQRLPSLSFLDMSFYSLPSSFEYSAKSVLSHQWILVREIK